MKPSRSDPTSTGDQTRAMLVDQVQSVSPVEHSDDKREKGRAKGREGETTPKLSPRLERHRKRAILALSGATYEQIHELVPSKRNSKPVKYPRQVVYNALQSPNGQKALAEVVSYTDEDINTRIGQSIQHFDPVKPLASHVKVLELGARVKGMVKDVQESRQVRVNVEVKAGPELASKLLQALKQANSGQDDPPVKQGKA